MATIKDLAEQYGVAKAQDQNENLGRLAEMLGSARDIGNQYKVPSWVPLAGGTGAGDLLMGRTPEEIENWSYGNAPMQIPEMSNVPQFKRGRAQSLADALTTLAPGVKVTEDLPVGMAIKGYHGSPHKFKEFDTAHMGSGEGGQAYGWGNYITEDPYVATTYSPQDEWMDEQLMNLYNQAERRQDYPSMEVYERYMMHERPNEVKDYLKESYADYPEDLPKRLPAQKIGENLYKKQKGSHLYEVSMEFPREREAVDPMSIEHFLDYDKPLSEQSDYVRNILQSHDPDMYHPEGSDYDPAEKGSSILQRFGSGKEGAQKLYELGIPGTTYMGEKAKVANPEGVRNFVTYSDEVPRVVTRNMNKVKPLTDEDRLNDLEKQMSAYMKTKRMPKGVDFKTGSDWYDWAYDKRAKLRGYAEGGSVDKDSLQLNKPRRTPNHPTKSHIVKTMVDGKEKIIRFGEQGAETAGKPKEGESDRMTAKRESFKARHAKNIAKGPSSAAYWANKVKWAEGGEVDIRDDEGYADDLARLKRAYENSNFGPNDSVIASTIHHPIEAAKRAKDSLMRSIDTAAGVPREILDESSAFPFGVAPSMDEQAQAGLDLAGLMQTGAMPFAPSDAGSLGTIKSLNFGELGFDPRFAYKDTKWELPRLKQMIAKLDVPDKEIPVIGLDTALGRGVYSGMSDRSGVHEIVSINDVPVNEQIKGGQPFMHFFNKGWASNKSPASGLRNSALEMYKQSGDNPLFLPFAMAPSGSDFNPSTGNTMFKYMANNMNKKEQRAVNKDIKNFIPGFKGIGTEEGIAQFEALKGDDRKEIQKFLHNNYRDKGGLSIGEVRLAMADPNQLTIPDASLMHVAEIYANEPLSTDAIHNAYSHALEGKGLGMLDRHIMAHEIYPHIVEERKIIDPRNPRDTDISSLRNAGTTTRGIITPEILRNIGYAYAKGGEVKALHDKYAEGGSVNTTPISYGFEYDQMANSLGLNNINYGGLNSGSTKTTTDTPKTTDTTPVTSGLSALTDMPIEKASTTFDTPASVTSEISALTSTPIEKAITTDTTPAPKSKGLYYDAEYNPTGTLVPTGRGGSRSNPGFKDAVARYQRDKDGVWHDYAIEGVSKWDLGSFTPLTSRQGLEAMIATKQQAADDALATQKQVIAMQHDPLNRNWNDTMANPLKDLNNPAYLAQQEVLKYQKELADLGSYTPYTPSSWWTGYAKGGSVKDLHNKYEESDYGYGNRPDKTKKGLGYFGELERPDGTGVMTEYSIGVPINGKEMDVPTLVPTLTPDEIRLILHMQEGEDMPRSIVHKAIDHAHQRLSEGKPIFATEEDLYAHGGIVDVLHNDAIEQIMKAFMDSMADDEPAVSIEITTQNTETPRRGKIPKSIAREAKHG